jgi:outer membrane protein assembly factor BamB
VTPYNVLLFASEDGWPVPKLGDWGLARARNEQASQSFTPGYAAPEQRQPDQHYRVHPRKTDLYQLGTILYELLTGKMPFSRHEREHKHHDPPSPPSQQRETIPEDEPVDTLLTQLLAPDPDNRPRSMAQVVTRLAACREQLSTNDSATQTTDGSEDGSNTSGDPASDEETPLEAGDTNPDSEEHDNSETSGDSPSTDDPSETDTVEAEFRLKSAGVECHKRVVSRETESGSRVTVGYELRSHRESTAGCELTDQLPPGVGRDDISVTESPDTAELAVEQPSVRLSTSVPPGDTVLWEYSLDSAAIPGVRYLQTEPHLETTTPAPATWRTFQATPRRGGAGGGHLAPNPPVTTRWQFDTSGRVYSSPAVAGGTVYVGSWDYSLYAVDAATGDQQWQFDTSDWVISSPAVVNGTVYIGSDDYSLYAVDAATGNQQWQFDTDGYVRSSPAVVDDTVYVGSCDECLYAVDAATGAKQWQFDTSGSVHSSPTATDHIVYVGSQDSSLYAVDALTGNKRWQFDTNEQVRSSPAVVDDTVYVGSNDNSLYAVDAVTGNKRWQFDTSGYMASSPAVVDSTVYVGSGDHSLYAVDAATGNQQWQSDTGGEVVSSPAVVGDTVYVGSYDNSLYAVDAATGNQQWQFDTDRKVRSSPAVVDGTVYVGSKDGSLYAVEGNE